MSVSVVGDGDLYYFKQGAWRSLSPVVASGGVESVIEQDGTLYRCHTSSPPPTISWCRGVGRWSTCWSQAVVRVVRKSG
jgi:hypothetical protein